MRNRSHVVFFSSFIGIGALLLGAEARAQTTSGFAIDRFEPSERGSDWFTLESLDLRGHGRWAGGLTLDYAHDPLAIYDASGNLRSAIVSDQLFGHVGGSLVLWDRLRIGASLPVAIYQTGDGGTLGGAGFGSPSDATTVGDLRIGADLRIVGRYGDPFTLGAGVQAWLPTGSRSDYTGDEDARLGPRVMAAGEIGAFEYAARVGFVYRGLDASYAGSALGSEMTWGASAGVLLLDKKQLLIGPEVFGSATVSNGDEIFKTRTTPVEGLLGAHLRIGSGLHVGAGGGAGLTRGYGTPAYRLVASIEWAPSFEPPPPPPPTDRDGDGIPDDTDACPDVKGVRSSDPKTNGCPPPPPPPPPKPKDTDGDGVPDVDDACVTVPGVHTDDPKTNGCPPPPADRDHDKIPDSEDACPDVPGIPTNFLATNGCPPDPDRDKDGIPNDQDACPDEPGKPDPDPKKNGCPQAIVRNSQIVILDQVKFATGSAVILPTSDPILQAVLKILTEHAEIKKVSVEGHTDNVGPAAYNKQLSAARAASVVTWLVQRGVARDRLTSAGFGMERPLVPNTSEPNRQQNRRVEFHITDPPPPPDAQTPSPSPSP